MQIKKANKEYIDKLSNLRIIQQKDDWKTLFYDDDLFNKAKNHLLKHLNQDVFIFMYQENDEIISTCSMQVISYLPQYNNNGKVGYLCNAYTKKEYRSRGLQTNLINQCMQFAKENEIYELELSVNNPEAASIYKNLGFVHDEWRMRIDLRK